MKNLIITGVYICGLIILLGDINTTDTAVLIGIIVGRGIVPLFNAHLMRKYLNLSVAKKHPLISMLVVSTVSLLINAMIVLIGILGAMAIYKIRSGKKIQN